MFRSVNFVAFKQAIKLQKKEFYRRFNITCGGKFHFQFYGQDEMFENGFFLSFSQQTWKRSRNAFTGTLKSEFTISTSIWFENNDENRKRSCNMNLSSNK